MVLTRTRDIDPEVAHGIFTVLSDALRLQTSASKTKFSFLRLIYCETALFGPNRRCDSGTCDGSSHLAKLFRAFCDHSTWRQSQDGVASGCFSQKARSHEVRCSRRVARNIQRFL
jgi:hypothetical protein